MTTCTPIYQLPYPEGGDDPCLVGGTLCDFATAAETVLDSFDATINRTATTIPMVKLARTIPTVYVAGASAVTDTVLFDTVIVDTDNMFNLANAAAITINTSGIYLVYMGLYADTTGGATLMGVAARVIVDASFSIVHEGFNTVGGVGCYLNGTQGYPISAGSILNTEFSPFVQSTDTITVNRVEAGAVWLGDLA